MLLSTRPPFKRDIAGRDCECSETVWAIQAIFFHRHVLPSADLLALSPVVPAVPPLWLGLAASSQRWFALACCLAARLCTCTCSEAG